MKEITKYIASDGGEFYTKEEAEAREALITLVDGIMKYLPQKPELPGCGFENGGGFIQHDKDTFLLVRKQLLDLTGLYITHRWVDETKKDLTVHGSWVGRLLDEYNLRPLSLAWNRVSNTDSQFREWGQGYYALHPEKGEQVQLN